MSPSSTENGLLVQRLLKVREHAHQPVDKEHGVHVAVLALGALALLLDHLHPLRAPDYLQKVVYNALRVRAVAGIRVEKPGGQGPPVAGLSVLPKVCGPQHEAFFLPVVQKAVRHLLRGKQSRLTLRVLQGLRLLKALICKLRRKGGLYQLKRVKIQMRSTPKSICLFIIPHPVGLSNVCPHFSPQNFLKKRLANFVWMCYYI